MGRPKRKTTKTKLTLQIEPGDIERLKTIALSLGCIVPSGKRTGQGSISAMLTAVAKGDRTIT